MSAMYIQTKRNFLNQERLQEYHQSADELQVDLDEWLVKYNTQRTLQGKICQGRTPMETLIDGESIWKAKFLN